MSVPVVHFEIVGKNGAKLQEFYRKLFDWKINADNPMHYGLVEAVSGGIGGGVSSAAPDTPCYVTVYAQVKDLDTYLKKAEGLGGKTLIPPTEIPGYVTFAMFQDPEGNTVGMIQG